jgi:hypothetical protein
MFDDLTPRVTINELDLHEYDSVKQELLDNIKNLSAHFHYALGGSAAFFSWLITHKPAAADMDSCYYCSGFMAFLVACMLYRQTRSAFIRIDEASSFVRSIENKFSTAGFGFESWVDRANSKFRKALKCSWKLLLLFDLIMPVLIPLCSISGN